MNASFSPRNEPLQERAGAPIGNSLSHLLYQEDKLRYWSADRSAYVIYATIAGKRVVLGDPVGKEANARAVLREFLSLSAASGRDCLFYHIGENVAGVLREFGFQTMKTGEEASVDLPGFHTNGKEWLKLRTRKNKLEREGYRCEVHLPPHADAMLAEVKSVSDAWLGKKREKSFSVGSYSETYVAAHPIATLRSPDGELLAFLTLAEYERPEGDRRLAIDLMRYKEGSPSGAMEVLFVCALSWGQSRGYAACSLGVSPLANACERPLWMKLARAAASRYYNFNGLRHFKAKFRPTWEDRFLAYPGRTPLFAIALLALLVHRRRGGRTDVSGAAAAVRSTN